MTGIENAFGLAHADCHGYDLQKTESIMSYNLRHHSHGLHQSQPLVGFAPEDFFVLGQNKLAFSASPIFPPGTIHTTSA